MSTGNTEIDNYVDRMVAHQKRITTKLSEKISELEMKIAEVQVEREVIQEYAAEQVNKVNGLTQRITELEGQNKIATARVVELEAQQVTPPEAQDGAAAFN